MMALLDSLGKMNLHQRLGRMTYLENLMDLQNALA